MRKTRRIVLLALFVSQALVLSIIESWIPIPAVVPGVKLGLANIITMVIIVFFNFSDALLVVIVRSILTSIFAGGPTVLFFSLSGGILSTVIMAFLYKRFSRLFSIIGISIAGAMTHNVGQLAAASVFMRELAVFTYLPVLFVSGIIMGCFVGICSNFLIYALKKHDAFR